MPTYRAKATVAADRTVTLKGIPFQPGAQVEVLVRTSTREPEDGNRYPLRGAPIRYVDPLAGVAEEDWDALR